MGYWRIGVGRPVSTAGEVQVTSLGDDLNVLGSAALRKRTPEKESLEEIASFWRELGMGLVHLQLSGSQGLVTSSSAFCNLRGHP